MSAPNQTEFPTKAAAVTPHDTNVLTSPGTIYVGVGGNVSVVPWEGSTAVLFKNLPAGAVIPVKVKQVKATSTTATDLVVIY